MPVKNRKTTTRQLTITYRPIDAILPYERNARTHTPAQIDKLRASLRRFGWTNPMLLADGKLIAGHARLVAARRMAEEGDAIPGNPDPWQAPTVDLSHLTPAERRAYVLTDNRIAEEAGWDNELLRLEFGDLQDAGFDLSLTGFDMPEIGDIMKGPAGVEAPDGFRAFDEDIETEHECPRCGYRFSGGRTHPANDGEAPDAAAAE